MANLYEVYLRHYTYIATMFYLWPKLYEFVILVAEFALAL